MSECCRSEMTSPASWLSERKAEKLSTRFVIMEVADALNGKRRLASG